MPTGFGSLANETGPSPQRPVVVPPPGQSASSTSPQVPPSGTVLNPSGGTQLVADPNMQMVLTANRETDARTALARGLKEYLENQVIYSQGGRQLRFRKIFSSWAEAESYAEYPSGAVTTVGEGLYDYSSFTPPTPSSLDQLPEPDGRYLQKLCEFDQTLMLELWCADPKSRSEMAYMIETTLSPVDWMYGCRLYLPHFFGQFATYELRTQRYVDTEDDAVKRYRKAVFGIHGHMSVVRLVSYPLARPGTRLSVL